MHDTLKINITFQQLLSSTGVEIILATFHAHIRVLQMTPIVAHAGEKFSVAHEETFDVNLHNI